MRLGCQASLTYDIPVQVHSQGAESPAKSKNKRGDAELMNDPG